MAILSASSLQAHEIDPAIVNVSVNGNEMTFEVELSLEAMLAGIDLSKGANTASSDNEAIYDSMRSLSPDDLRAKLTDDWASLKSNFLLNYNDKHSELNLTNIEIHDVGDEDIVRLSTMHLTAEIPPNSTEFRFGWKPEFGLMVLRRSDLDGGFAGYVEPGELSPPLALDSAFNAGPWKSFIDFIPVGFDHIVPKGTDHILFVVGLFLLSARLRPLMWQISAFTLAHTITLALASLNIITVSAAIVEPLIAISIAYVAIENLFVSRMTLWRPALVFVFGLLHGLGFASVLSEFGLPGAGFVTALIGFNVGVELGQILVIGVCFALFGYWFRDKIWYRTRISIPMSAVIACVGLWWAFERVFF